MVTDSDAGKTSRARPDDRTKFQMWMKRGHYEELKMLAEYEGRTVSDIVRELVRKFLRDNGSRRAG